MPARLDNVLNLQSLTMMMDLLLSTGLVLHPTRAVPAGQERVQIVLRARRDPSNEGYVYLESIEGNNVRYTVRLDIKNKSWSKIRSGGFGTAVSQTGEPVIHNPTSGPTEATGGEAGAQGFQSWDAHPEGAVIQATETGGYQQTIGAQRDTFFAPGPVRPVRRRRGAHDLADQDLAAVNPGQHRLAERSALRLRVVAGHRRPAAGRTHRGRRAQGAGADPARRDPPRDPARTPPAGVAAIEEEAVTPGPAPGALNITAADLLDRRVVNLGYDHEKLQILFGEVMAKLAGNELPASGQRSHAVARLTEHGTRAQDALRYLLSHPVFTRYLDKQLDDGMTMPDLVRPGGAWTDTHGELSVQVELAQNPHVLGYVSGWDEAVKYEFDEQEQHRSRTGGWALGADGGAAFNTGKAGPSSPSGGDFAIDVSFGSRQQRSGNAIQQTMTKVDAINRTLSWLRVAPDAVITVTLTARNERDLIKVSKLGTWLDGGKVAVRFRVRHALELALSPEASIRLGIYHPGGIPVGSGTFFPRRPGAAGPASASRTWYGPRSRCRSLRARSPCRSTGTVSTSWPATGRSTPSSWPPRSIPGSANSETRRLLTSRPRNARRRRRPG